MIINHFSLFIRAYSGHYVRSYFLLKVLSDRAGLTGAVSVTGGAQQEAVQATGSLNFSGIFLYGLTMVTIRINPADPRDNFNVWKSAFLCKFQINYLFDIPG